MPDIPPWLKPADVAGNYATGLQLGQAAARLQQQANEAATAHAEAAQRLELSRQNAEKEHELEAQRLAISKAYQDQQISLKKQEVGQAAQRLQMETHQAAVRYEIGQRIAAGEDPAKVYSELGGDAGIPGAALTMAIRRAETANMAKIPEKVMVGEGENKTPFWKIPTESGYRWQTRSEQMDPMERMERQQEFSLWKSEKEKLEKHHAEDTGGALNANRPDSELTDLGKAQKKKYLADEKQIELLDKKLKSLIGDRSAATDTEAEPSPSGVQKAVRGPDGRLVPATATASPGASQPRPATATSERAQGPMIVAPPNRSQDIAAAWTPAQPVARPSPVAAAAPAAPSAPPRPKISGMEVRGMQSDIKQMDDTDLDKMALTAGAKVRHRNGKWVTWQGDDWTDTKTVSRDLAEKLILEASLKLRMASQ